jgi:single-stranded-DNA-specific exonuclease
VIEPRFRWILSGTTPSAALLRAGADLGLGAPAVTVLAGRGIAVPDDLTSFFADPVDGLHDPRDLPDAEVVVERIRRARQVRERVLVVGDFDADGLTGLAILVLALEQLGVEAIPYVPDRAEEGHGLSMAAVEVAADGGVGLIITVDCGSTSGPEIAAAAARGMDVVVTDHHRMPETRPSAIAVVNPHRADSSYPDRRLTGSGVAFKVAQLLLADEPGGAAAAVGLADLATIGTVSDMAPLVGENRSIARLGLERIRTAPRPGLAALLEQARTPAERVDLEAVGFVIAPRLNAAGRVGDAIDAARLLLAGSLEEAAPHAEALESANATRRDLTRRSIDEARALAPQDDVPAVVVRGPWALGIVGLVASRLADDAGRPAVVGSEQGDVVRASCRSGPGFDLAAALVSLDDLLVRHGGHAGAAGFEVAAERWDEFRDRFLALASAAAADPAPASLAVDLALPARDVDYPLVRDLRNLGPFGPGNPEPLVAVLDLEVARVRPANGGHTQLVLRRDPDVLDGIAFGRSDLVGSLAEGERVDVVARLASRSFGGFESLQLEVRDVGPAGATGVAASPLAAPADAGAAVVAGLRGADR